jgi:hypothetical protein
VLAVPFIAKEVPVINETELKVELVGAVRVRTSFGARLDAVVPFLRDNLTRTPVPERAGKVEP